MACPMIAPKRMHIHTFCYVSMLVCILNQLKDYYPKRHSGMTEKYNAHFANVMIWNQSATCMSPLKIFQFSTFPISSLNPLKTVACGLSILFLAARKVFFFLVLIFWDRFIY